MDPAFGPGGPDISGAGAQTGQSIPVMSLTPKSRTISLSSTSSARCVKRAALPPHSRTAGRGLFGGRGEVDTEGLHGRRPAG
ncbi:hypothetical protein RCH17_001385 [Arthrobacter sp. MP_M7]|nr:hypothetical protein [Arthrobacter sp. MP_M4]MEC5202582.1 hypothetical protein [Arthrobacter sp. MP_M7]